MNRIHACLYGGLLPVLMSGAMLLTPWTAFAQQQSAPQELAPPPSDAPAVPIAEEKLDRFAEAFIVVEAIQRQTLQQLEVETDASKAEGLKAKAENDAVAAVEKSGLPLVEFNQIAQQMMTDLTLREKVAQRVAQRRPSAPTPTS